MRHLYQIHMKIVVLTGPLLGLLVAAAGASDDSGNSSQAGVSAQAVRWVTFVLSHLCIHACRVVSCQ